MNNLLKIVEYKKCKICNLNKHYSDFSINNAAKDKLQSRCRSCDKDYQSKRRIKYSKEIRDYSREYQREKRKNFDFRLKMLLNASKQRAVLKNREHSITIEDIKKIYPVDGKCPVFGIELKFNSAGFRDDSPSIDRIDSSKGYTKDNIQIISWKANRIKSYATVEELQTVLNYLIQGEYHQ